MRICVNGSDTYGVWVAFKANSSSCAGGFYLPQKGDNRDMVYSTALSAKMANQKICFQFFVFNLIMLQSQKCQTDAE